MHQNLSADQLRKIEENRRIALQKRHHANATVNSTPQINNIKQFLTQPPAANGFRNTFPKKNGVSLSAKTSSGNISSSAKVEAACVLLSSDRFCVQMPYHAKSIEIMKNCTGRIFDQSKKSWSFPISHHDEVVHKLNALKPEVTVTGLPSNVVNCLRVPPPDVSQIDIDKIDSKLCSTLLPFQTDGVRFGISRKGRCLIGDEMGLGKTLQALGIAHYYEESWPLLIVCPSSMRFPWEQSIIEFVPSVNPYRIVVMTTANDDMQSHQVVITSYDLLKSKSLLPALKRKKFGVVIFDESHYIKNGKSARTEAAQQVATGISHVILLSGTPALSRPQELFPQLKVIDPAGFKSFHDFGIRYCDGKLNKFGWDFSGASNSLELEILLKAKFMIRRMKADVFEQMPSKSRKVVYLQPKMILSVSKQMEMFATQIVKEKGLDQRNKMLEWYSATAPAKLPAVLSYIEDKLTSDQKMLVFGHHAIMLEGIAVRLVELGVKFIRIDGSTSPEQRSQLCEAFQVDRHIKVAVLSIKAANAGITLTAASLVVFVELYWNPGELQQAEDRAHRIGQNESVLVEYLVAKGTSDDFMMKMIGDKLNVLNQCGLSKDNFRNIETTTLADKDQLTIPEMFQVEEEVHNGDSSSATHINNDVAQFNAAPAIPELSSSQIGSLFSADYESMEDAFIEDDVFDNLDLNSIEETHSEAKRQKLDS